MKTKGHNPGKPCGLVRRLAIIFYDFAIVISLLILATMLAMFAGFGGRTALKDPGYTLYLFAVWFLYVTWCWHHGGMTVGMRAWRVRIEDEKGLKPGWGRSAVRFFAALLSTAVAGMGYLWSLVDSRQRTWHDIISNTRMIRF